jgi:lysozyme|tara:strand:+ start:299 stop:922 length:624 start_codon:yes stop_codon:yes gene_type:complete
MRLNKVGFLLIGLSLLIMSACGGGEDEPVLVPPTMAPTTTTLMDLSTTVPMTTTTYAAPATIVPVAVETTTTTTIALEPKETQPESVTVAAGDSLSEIAKANGTTSEKLARINGICNVNSIYVGQVIMLIDPEKEVEIETDETQELTVKIIVESGDSLSKIAKREGVTVDEIMSINDITDPNLLFVGQELTISGQTSSEQQEEDPVC